MWPENDVMIVLMLKPILWCEAAEDNRETELMWLEVINNRNDEQVLFWPLGRLRSDQNLSADGEQHLSEYM